jgi:hypothetical protein
MRRRQYPRPAALLLLLPLAVVAGCGYGNTSRVPVKGEVTFDDAPVDNGVIIFLPDGDSPGGGEGIKCGGPIVDGKYALEAGKGPRPGHYRVEIVWNKKTGKQVPSNDPPNLIDETVQVLPEKFNTKSTLTADVKPQANVIDFPLKSK